MLEITIIFLCLVILFVLPYIISFFVAMFCVPEMPTENRRPSSIKDCVKCMFFDGYTDTKYGEWYSFFVFSRIPIVGFVTTVFLGIFMGIAFVIYFIGKLLLYIPGAKKIVGFVTTSFSKIINYNFR